MRVQEQPYVYVRVLPFGHILYSSGLLRRWGLDRHCREFLLDLERALPVFEKHRYNFHLTDNGRRAALVYSPDFYSQQIKKGDKPEIKNLFDHHFRNMFDHFWDFGVVLFDHDNVGVKK
jgi:hypothetical protein